MPNDRGHAADGTHMEDMFRRVAEEIGGREWADLDELTTFLKARRGSEEDKELVRFPLIEVPAPHQESDPETLARIELARENVRMAAQVAMGRMVEPGEKDTPTDSDSSFHTFETVLAHTTDVSQFQRLLDAYVHTQTMIKMRQDFRLPIQGPLGLQVIDTTEIERQLTQKVPARQKTLSEYARNPEWEAFRLALDTSGFEAYWTEPGNDSTFTLLADPSKVYLLYFDPEENGKNIPKMERRTPPEKRMTKAKLIRFFQLRGLKKLVEKDDVENRHPAATGTNLAVLAEYFYENDVAGGYKSINLVENGFRISLVCAGKLMFSW